MQPILQLLQLYLKHVAESKLKIVSKMSIDSSAARKEKEKQMAEEENLPSKYT